MNLPTILITIVLIALFVLAIRYLAKKGACAGCSEKGSCHSGGDSCEHCKGHSPGNNGCH
jgi:hypothetical protein